MSEVDLTESSQNLAISQVAATDQTPISRPMPQRPAIMGDAALSSTFDGVNTTATGVEMYIQSVETRAERMGGDVDKVRRIIFYNGLRGIARWWFQVQPERIRDDWRLLKGMFVEDFSVGASAETLLLRALGGLRQGTMSLLDYVGKADELASLINETGKQMAEQLAYTFVNGISEGVVKRAMILLLTRVYDFAQAREAALSIYNSWKDSPTANPMVSVSTARAQTSETPGQGPSLAQIAQLHGQALVAPRRPDTDRRTPLTQAYAGRPKREVSITCYNCLETGHYCSDCPSARAPEDMLAVNREEVRRRYNGEKGQTIGREASLEQVAQNQASRAERALPEPPLDNPLEDPVAGATGLHWTEPLRSRVDAADWRKPPSLQTQPSGRRVGQGMEFGSSQGAWRRPPAQVREELHQSLLPANGINYQGRVSTIPPVSVKEPSGDSPFPASNLQDSSRSGEVEAADAVGNRTVKEISQREPIIAWVGGKSLRTLIDSGSPANFISKGAVKRIGLVPRLLKEKRLGLFSDDIVLELEECVDIKVNVAEIFVDVVAYVAEIGVAYDLVLSSQCVGRVEAVEGHGEKRGKKLLVRRVKARGSPIPQTPPGSDGGGDGQPLCLDRRENGGRIN